MNRVLRSLIVFAAAVSMAYLQSCDDEDPAPENIPEVITRATLRFTPAAGTNAPVVSVTASDPDREGPQKLRVDGSINLQRGVTYTLTMELINELAAPGTKEFDITKEIQEEADEHMFFFGWTNDVFSSPTGNGNIDNRADPVNYNDRDSRQFPLGLNTTWTTARPDGALSGRFRVMLKHQPGIKSATSGSGDGKTDFDVDFAINVN
jgi:hypothetical protein